MLPSAMQTRMQREKKNPEALRKQDAKQSAGIQCKVRSIVHKCPEVRKISLQKRSDITLLNIIQSASKGEHEFYRWYRSGKIKRRVGNPFWELKIKENSRFTSTTTK